MENIIPSSDLRNRYQEISKLCKESNKPIFITVNGRGDTVLLSNEAYQKLEAELELLKMLAKSEIDVKEGNIGSVDEMMKSLKKKYKLK